MNAICSTRIANFIYKVQNRYTMKVGLNGTLLNDAK